MIPDMGNDKELGPIPAHIRAQAIRECEGSAPSSAGDYYSHARWIFSNKTPIHPRSEVARMLRISDPAARHH